MAMRMSGLISGLDTDSLISSLVSAKRLKATKATGEQTKLSWKQEKWKDLNKQLVSLRSSALNMRYSSSWAKKTTTVSNPAKASVITGSNAVNAVQSLKINHLAKSGYLTGGEVAAYDSEGNKTGGKITALSKMSDLGFEGDSASIEITAGGTTKSVTFGADSTVSDVLSALKNQGLNASFDEKNQRFFISAKSTGAENDFAITASNGDGKDLLDSLGISTYDSKALDSFKKTAESYQKMIDDPSAEALNRAKAAAESYKSLYNSMNSALKSLDALKAERLAMDEDGSEATTEEKEALDARITEAQNKYDDLHTQVEEAEGSAIWSGTVTTDDDGSISITDVAVNTDAQASLEQEIRDEYTSKLDYVNQQITAIENGTLKGTASNKITGVDAEIELNGAKFTNSTNVFEINGLTITALGTTDKDEEITLTTDADTSGIYDMVKNFFKSYNSIINELDKLYNAESSSKLTPLTDEEKDALSENEVEKYETKIKDGLFKGDETISSIRSGLTSVLSAGIDLNGKKVYLSDFGINTQNYLAAEANTTHAYHIDGDSDDEVSASNTDKLKSMIASDPDFVTNFFTKLSQSLYNKLDSLSSRVAGRRTFGTFYEDQTMKSDYTNYTSKISELEEKANDYEDRLYAKFSKMEATMAKLQSKSSGLTGLLGGS